MIKLNSASISYKGKSALTDITLHIKQGQKLALVGHSGSGKSSLLNLIYNSQTGSLNNIALIPQEYGLVQNLSVFHNVYMGELGEHPFWYNLLNLIKPLHQPLTDISQILQKVSLADKIFEPVAQLSGGQQQRTAIARAILHSGECLLADEPVSSLDEKQSYKIMALLCKQFNTIVFSLHDIDLALKFCDRIIGIDNGRIVINDYTDNLSRAELLQLYEK
jgi:phosphonate transport system ATP-binding protein